MLQARKGTAGTSTHSPEPVPGSSSVFWGMNGSVCPSDSSRNASVRAGQRGPGCPEQETPNGINGPGTGPGEEDQSQVSHLNRAGPGRDGMTWFGS
ncbi:hypothetical protein NHX12_030712 [Muraenolepis orangiensis]|uniref:Uncharacterized protein n=1 Tax=Muraenolepis orangiensis TaxID=630683 RepID=A0A9Q0IM45_9TELE|nr:hypothetical protein NHX12_030712 [Muraenolepis orangiensis]